MRERFLQAMRATASTVSVVTTDGPAGRAGTTISAMSSVSADLEKPVLLICINQKNSAADAIRKNKAFCVNVLYEDQQEIAESFARRQSLAAVDKFSCAHWSLATTGTPRIDRALIAFDCRLSNDVIVGSHHVLFGDVEDIFLGEPGKPLLYSKGRYGGFTHYDSVNELRSSLSHDTSAEVR